MREKAKEEREKEIRETRGGRDKSERANGRRDIIE